MDKKEVSATEWENKTQKMKKEIKKSDKKQENQRIRLTVESS